MRRRKRNSEGSLDSLLDTMTNVVGILVIVLVITKLGVGHAVQRIRNNLPDVTVEEHAAIIDQLAKIEAEKKTWDQRLQDADKPLTDAQVEELWAKIEAIEEEVVKENEVVQAITAVTPQVQQLEKQAAALAKQITTTVTQLDKLEEMVTTTPKVERPKPKIVNLPNPRAAPEDAAATYFVCKEGKILEVPLDIVFRLSQSRLNRLQVQPDKDGKVDCAKVIELFNRTTINNPAATASLKVINYRLYLVVNPLMARGETPEQIAAADSRFQRQVRAMKVNNRYARFVVWADSYDVYLAARSLMHSSDVPAGWVPYHPNAEWRIAMPDAPVCFRPPPPAVVPKPNPPVTPPKPTTPTIPPPQPKKVPKDDID